MSPVKRRRRLPTLINRGSGLLEIFFPRGVSESGESFLPPGQRDASGFWFPAGYDKPDDIFSPLQRQLQENQRQIQKRRLRARDVPPLPAGGDGTMTVNGSSGEAHSPPADPLPAASEVEVPLPSPLPETGPPSRPRRPFPAGVIRSSPAGSTLLPDADARPPSTRARVVDSREGSD